MENIKDKAIDLKEHAEDLAGHIEDIAETWYKLAQLNLTEKTANITSAGITMMIVFIAGIFVMLFGGFALSWWLGDLVSNRIGGFLLGAGFFLVVMIIIILLRKKIIFPFMRNLIIRKIYD